MVSFRFLFVGTALLAAPVMAAFRESEQLIKNLDGVTEQIDAMQAMAEAADFSQPMSTDEEDDFTAFLSFLNEFEGLPDNIHNAVFDENTPSPLESPKHRRGSNVDLVARGLCDSASEAVTKVGTKVETLAETIVNMITKGKVNPRLTRRIINTLHKLNPVFQLTADALNPDQKKFIVKLRKIVTKLSKLAKGLKPVQKLTHGLTKGLLGPGKGSVADQVSGLPTII